MSSTKTQPHQPVVNALSHTILTRPCTHRQFFQTRYEDLQQGLFAQQPALFPADVFTFDNFLWAVATVRSRAHAPLEADKIALVPLADSIPHSRSGNTSWKVKAGGLFSRAQVGGMACSVGHHRQAGCGICAA